MDPWHRIDLARDHLRYCRFLCRNRHGIVASRRTNVRLRAEQHTAPDRPREGGAIPHRAESRASRSHSGCPHTGIDAIDSRMRLSIPVRESIDYTGIESMERGCPHTRQRSRSEPIPRACRVRRSDGRAVRGIGHGPLQSGPLGISPPWRAFRSRDTAPSGRGAVRAGRDTAPSGRRRLPGGDTEPQTSLRRLGIRISVLESASAHWLADDPERGPGPRRPRASARRGAKQPSPGSSRGRHSAAMPSHTWPAAAQP